LESYFSKYYNKLKYPKASDKEEGLRNAQVGAIHSISAYFTINISKAAIVVMPTGSGKTGVLMITPYLLGSNKVLVVTPSQLVRSQIVDEYSNLKTLVDINVLPQNTRKPKVYEMKKLFSEEQVQDIFAADVVVATPQGGVTISNANEIKSKFDLVLIDEAHHVPAKTWSEILENMNEAKQVLFTATPFRMDNKSIRGRIIYNYPLSHAYRDGIFGEIQYIPIHLSEDKDKLIAKKAESIFLQDREKGFEHFLMVRTNSKPRAKELEELYNSETMLNLRRIDSSMSIKTVYRCVELLRKKELDGIICVDMLGEGFDFPNLKIAALHDPHKSLGSTLQFIGRFARTNASNIDVAKFIAMNDEELLIENTALYKSDSIWQEIIIDLSENRISREESEKEYISEYVDHTKNEPDLEVNLSLHTIRPNCHAKLYKIEGFNLHSIFPKICNIIHGPFTNTDDNTVVAIGKGYESPKWYTGDLIRNEENFLYVIHYQSTTKILFIYSQVKSEFIYEKIAESFSMSYKKVPKHEMNRVLGNLNDFEIFNSGMQNRFNESGESYRISAGSDVSQAIDPSTGKLYSVGHVFCKAFSDEKQITIGYSSGSKVWSSAYAPLKDYILWCDLNGAKIFNSDIVVKTKTNYDFLPIPMRLENYPINVFMVDFSGDTYTNPSLVYDKEFEKPIGLITDFDLNVIDVSEKVITIAISMDGIIQIAKCNIDGKYKIEEERIMVFEGRNKIPLSRYLDEYSLIFRTTDDVMIQGIEITKGDPDAITFSSANIHPIPWKEKYNT
jgi:superfamily II DNA or RNA helicase